MNTSVFLNYDIRLSGESGAEGVFEDFRRIRKGNEGHLREWELNFSGKNHGLFLAMLRNVDSNLK